MLVARDVYYHLADPPKDARNRTIPKLRDKLKELAAEGKPTATRNNQKLTDWRRDYNWDQWCAEEDDKNVEVRMEKARVAAERAIGLMALDVDKVVAVMLGLLHDANTPPAVKAKLLDSYFDRIGAKAAPVTASAPDVDSQKLPAPPPDGATPEEKQAWIAQVQRRQPTT